MTTTSFCIDHYLAPFISPYINIADFPISFKIIENLIHPMYFILNSMFFKQVSNSPDVIKFKESNEYKNAKALFDLTENKKLLDKFNNNEHTSLHLNLFDYFPLNREPDHGVFWTAHKYAQYIIANPLEERQGCFYNHKYTVLGDLKSTEFFILKRDLEILMLNDMLRFQMPYISRTYINKLLEPYLDLQFRFIDIIEITIKNNYELLLFNEKFRYKFLKNSELSYKPEIFLYIDIGFLKPTLLINNGNGMVVFYSLSTDRYRYGVCIYSNTYPIEDNELKQIKSDLQFVNRGELVIEIKNNNGVESNG